VSLYNMLFGQNPIGDVLLATLGLKQDDVGRYRDCFVADGHIAVYTRNGGGNRRCWCRDEPIYGTERCKHHVVAVEVNETAFMPKSEWPNDKAPGNYFRYEGAVYGCEYLTGKRVMRDHFHCDAPISADCACPGCVVEYRLPKHPLYVRDVDDDFDCTYATIYFRFPDEYADDLKRLENKEPFDPSARWIAMLERVGAKP